MKTKRYMIRLDDDIVSYINGMNYGDAATAIRYLIREGIQYREIAKMLVEEKLRKELN